MMNKNHYEMLAKYIVKFYACDTEVRFVILLDALCVELKNDNPDFNKSNFVVEVYKLFGGR